MKTIFGKCKVCGTEFKYNDCADLTGMMDEEFVAEPRTEHDKCRECSEKESEARLAANPQWNAA